MSTPNRPGTSTAERKRLVVEMKCDILDEVRQKIKKSVVARTHGIVQSILATIMKNSNKIPAVLDHDDNSGKRKRIRAATYGDVGEALYQLLLDASATNLPLTASILLQQNNTSLGIFLGDENLKQGNRRLQWLEEQPVITCKSILADNASVDEDGFQHCMVNAPQPHL
ncbi:hypothetical protein HPB48_001050 [Haemaphysalis longicornis]|uniref:Uncharacterized protein n=1 Tax=Haemaphysalis longicornis TaxID=44386 RepID=A0A9J6GUM6_HAELO|nr:hypothetical protein HPB48_001050 [Haemaphysalis longicornis]